MKLAACFLAGLSTVMLAQTSSRSTEDAHIQQLHELHDRAYTALRAEQERSKQPLCPNALSTVDMNECSVQEFDTTEHNYKTIIMAISALLGGLTDVAGGSVATTPFNEAEATWHTYRGEACNAFAGPLKNAGTSRSYLFETCLIALTRSHMNSLGDLYTDVGMH